MSARELADDDVGYCFELAGGEGVGQKQIDGAGEAVDAERGALAAEGDASFLGDGVEAVEAFGPRASVGDEVAVGELREVVGKSLDAEDSFDARVVGVEIGETDWPVVSVAAVGLGFEFVVAEPERGARPEERAAAEEAYAHPVVWFLGIVGVGDFFFVDPGIGVVFVGLEDVGELAGLFESAKGESGDGLDLGVFVHVGDGAGVEHEARDAFFGEDLCGHSTGVAGADDQDVNYFFGHECFGSFSGSSRLHVRSYGTAEDVPLQSGTADLGPFTSLRVRMTFAAWGCLFHPPFA